MCRLEDSRQQLLRQPAQVSMQTAPQQLANRSSQLSEKIAGSCGFLCTCKTTAQLQLLPHTSHGPGSLIICSLSDPDGAIWKLFQVLGQSRNAECCIAATLPLECFVYELCMMVGWLVVQIAAAGVMQEAVRVHPLLGMAFMPVLVQSIQTLLAGEIHATSPEQTISMLCEIS